VTRDRIAADSEIRPHTSTISWPIRTLKTRAVTDDLKGMSDALHGLSGDHVAICIVHLIRNSLDFANWKEGKLMATALRADLDGADRRSDERRAGHVRARSVGPDVCDPSPTATHRSR